MSTSIYLDSAATTSVYPEVVEEMVKVLTFDYGNPSSTYALGRHSKSLIENARKTIAKELNAQSSEIVFTSCGTEGNNWIIRSCVNDLGIKRIISTTMEHHCTLYSIQHIQKQTGVEVVYLNVLSSGEIDYRHLEQLLVEDKKPTLVSLMHVNNEIGTVLDLERVSALCKANEALFHSDTVQSVGKFRFDLEKTPIDFIVASGHKFHGPKGVGFVYMKKTNRLQPLIYGGEQEKGLRAGTEAPHQVVGMAKALELSYAHLNEHEKIITDLRDYCKSSLENIFPGVKFNGGNNGFYNVLNIQLPFSEEKTAMILFHLDMKGIAVSRGSACQSGSQKPSHVLSSFLPEEELKKPSLRLSFGYENTQKEIDYLLEVLQSV